MLTHCVDRGRHGLALVLAAVLAGTVSLLLLAGARAGVISPQSGWYSGNPLLGPATLTDVACAGDTCYASGTEGTLLKSSDGGGTWSGVVSGVQQELESVQIVGGNPDSLVAGGECVLRRSDDGGKTFSRLPFSARDSGCPARLAAFAFPSSSTGYLVLESGAVVASADGGRTFSRRTAVPAGQVRELLCTSDATCFAVAADGTIQRTTDGAVSWTRVGAAQNAQLRAIAAAGSNTMYAVGDHLTLMKSVDGGTTWSQKAITGVGTGDASAISCADASKCLIATADGSRLLRTTDGGTSFTSIVASSDSTFGVAFAAGTKAVAVGSSGSAEISSDAGANWKAVGSRIDGPFQVLHAVSGSVAYAGGAGGVLARTVDSGQSWANISPPTDANILAIAAPTANTVFVLASDGSLQRSDNGGSSYQILNTGARRLPSAMVALDGDRILLIGPSGIRRSSNGGDRFQSVSDGAARRASVRSAQRVGKAVVAYGPRTLIVSRDGGQTWTKIKRPRKRAIRGVSFGTARAGFLLDTRGALWRTLNGGKSWRELRTLGAWNVRGLEFSDATHGFALAGQIVLRTSNGGKSWHPQFLIGGRVSALQASAGTAYALVSDSILYATTTGGDVGAPQQLSLNARPSFLKKPRTITINGRLSPADGGEDVLVSRFVAGGWSAQKATVASNGEFTTRWRVSKTSEFVAQIFGDADHAGTGTTSLTIKVGRR